MLIPDVFKKLFYSITLDHYFHKGEAFLLPTISSNNSEVFKTRKDIHFMLIRVKRSTT